MSEGDECTDGRILEWACRTDPGPPALLKAVFELTADGLLVSDPDGMLRAANRMAQQLFGYDAGTLLGQPLHRVLANVPERDGGLPDDYEGEHPGLHREGERLPLRLRIRSLRVGERRWSLIACHDLREQHRLNERIVFLSTHDRATGCPDPEHFRTLLQSAGRRGQELALLLIGFEDRGLAREHDRWMAARAACLRQALGDDALLGRTAACQFAVALVQEAGGEQAPALAARLLEALRQDHGDGVPLLPSIGIGLYPQQAEDIDELLRRAGCALGQARRLGHGAVCAYDHAASEARLRTAERVERLRQAVQRGELELHYQVQFDLRTLAVSGMEALLRWRDRQSGLLAPGQFLALAFEHGLMPEIGRWVIGQACQDARRLAADGLLDVGVAVNVCASLFSEGDFVEFVQETLARTGLPAQRLELEITEDEAMKNPLCIQAHAGRLHEIGVRLAMDDFGVGYSSLGRLRSLRFSTLKIDRSFVLRLPGSRSDEAIIRAVLAIATDLGMQAVAEGVENQRQLECLRELGCGHGQGFWFARPMPMAELVRWLCQRCGAVTPLNTEP